MSFYEDNYGYLSKGAQERLNRGPRNTKPNGPGYIYVVQEEFGDNRRCKVGRAVDPKQRIKVMERKNGNGKEYALLYCKPTSYMNLTEKVIHRQLTDEGRRAPKGDGDGRTEWFRGPPVHFKDTIKKVVKEVEYQHGSDYEDSDRNYSGRHRTTKHDDSDELSDLFSVRLNFLI